jgi:hypothetical protein
MGCDFYTFYKLCIEYSKDGKTEIYSYDLTEDQQRQDWWHVERDEDFEEWDDYLKRRASEKQRQLDSIFRREYPRVDLCVNREWKCISMAKNRYLEKAEQANIPESDIVNVWKEGSYWVR